MAGRRTVVGAAMVAVAIIACTASGAAADAHCRECWGTTSGPCRHNDNWSCVDYVSPGVCPAGTTECVPVDCAVAEWGAWGACDAECGGGFQTRTRALIHAHDNGGAGCPPLSAWRTCNQQPCGAAQCVWSEWSDWTHCSQACGTGTQRRVREVVAGPGSCTDKVETRECNAFSCDNCVVCAPGTSGPCQRASGPDMTCYEYQNGRCPAGTAACVTLGKDVGSTDVEPSHHRCTACFGTSSGPCRHDDSSVCHRFVAGTTTCPAGTTLCAPANCAVSEWSEWTTCSSSCGGGQQSRSRSVVHPPAHGGAGCPGLTQVRDCNTQACPPEAVDCVLSQWSHWGRCSARCDGGSQFRSRTVLVAAAHGGRACDAVEDRRSCNEERCDECTSCIGSTEGPCQNPANKVCYGYLVGTTSCPPGTRKCADDGHAISVMDIGHVGSGQCSGCFGYSAGPCKHDNDNSCHQFVAGTFDCPVGTTACTPVDCAVTAWADWSSCSVSCGGGFQTRTRAVATAPSNGGATCPALSETRACNTETCLPKCNDCALGTAGPCQHLNDNTCLGYTAAGVCPAGATECVVQECVVSAWSAWGPCSKACGSGSSSRSRSVLVHPSAGAAPCPALSDTKSCNTQDCGHCVNCAGGTSGPCQQDNNQVCYNYYDGTTTCPAGSHACTDNHNTFGLLGDHAGDAGDGLCSGCFGESAGPCRHNRDQSCHAYMAGTHDCPAGTTPCAPVSCQVSEWTAWGACSAACDGGIQARQRTVLVAPTNGGMQCPHTHETQACNTARCPRACEACAGSTAGPCRHENDNSCVAYDAGTTTCPAGSTECANVDCAVSDWSDWGDCSAECGGGRQRRTRRVLVRPSVHGAACPSLEDSRACNEWACDACVGCAGATSGPCKQINNHVCHDYYAGTQNCPAGTRRCHDHSETMQIASFGGLGDGMCSSCDGATAGPCRHLNDNSCFAYIAGTTQCPAGTAPCAPVNCVMSGWTAWSSCSVDCGGGVQTRSRSIVTPPSNGGALCGATSESRSCNTDACPAVCTGCAGNTAGPCKHLNDFTCLSLGANGNCPAGSLLCQDVDCVVSEWGAWSGCSAHCGGGLKTRSRSILAHPQGRGAACPALSESNVCHTHPCDWCAGCVGGTAGPCRQDNDGTCFGYFPGTTFCPAGSTACVDAGHDFHTLSVQPGDGMCSACVGNTKGPCRHDVDSSCHAFMAGTTTCPPGTTVCQPINCAVSAWSAWSECSVACGGGGSRTRTRTVVTPASNGGAGCPALQEVDVHCNEPACPHVCSACVGGTAGPCQHNNDNTCLAYTSAGVCPAGSTECNPVDCVVSEWSAFSLCSVQCGGGQKTRTRHVVVAAANGGRACPALSDTVTCNAHACDACAGCGGGTSGPCRHDDNFSCMDYYAGTTNCPAGSHKCHDNHESFHTLSFDAGEAGDGLCSACVGRTAGPCQHNADGTCFAYVAGTTSCPAGTHACRPVNCHVGAWSDWSACSAQCGGGVQTRSRGVLVAPSNGGMQCPGLWDSRACNTDACVPSCTFCHGSTHGPCKHQNDNTCVAYGPNGQCPAGSVDCAAPVDCVVSQWSHWGHCSVGCGGGSQTRTRTVVRPAANGGNACPVLSDSRSCNNEPCHFCGNCAAGTSGPCKNENNYVCYDYYAGTTVCPAGTSACAAHGEALGEIAIAGVELGAGFCGGCRGESFGPCRHDVDDSCFAYIAGTRMCPAGTHPCEPSGCAVTEWSAWSECPAGCTHEVSIRRRFVVAAPFNGGIGCPALEETRACPSDSCSVDGTDCAVTEWGAWGPCSAPCNGGVQERRRTVSTPANGGKACPALIDVRSCNVHNCNSCAGCLAGSAGPCIHLAAPVCYAYYPGTQDCPAGTTPCEDMHRTFGVLSVEEGDGKCSECAHGTSGACRNVDNNVCYEFIEGTANCPAGTMPCAPLNCLMSAWSGWSDCSKPCGTGARTRTRRVTRPARNGGAQCVGDLQESQVCNTHGCPATVGESSSCGACAGGTSGPCRHNADNSCHEYYVGTTTCPAGTTQCSLCSACAGNTAGPCRHNNDGSCVAFQSGTTCPAGTTRCDSDGEPEGHSDAGAHCNGCWPGTAGPCQSADTVCFDYFPGTTMCPAGTTKCESGGSHQPLPTSVFDVHLTGTNAHSFDANAFQIGVASAAGTDARSVIIESVTDARVSADSSNRRLAGAVSGVNVGFVVVSNDPVATKTAVSAALESKQVTANFAGFNQQPQTTGADASTEPSSKPSALTIGLIAAGLAVGAALVAVAIVMVRRRRRSHVTEVTVLAASPRSPKVMPVSESSVRVSRRSVDDDDQ